jgi:hypothetical protein
MIPLIRLMQMPGVDVGCRSSNIDDRSIVPKGERSTGISLYFGQVPWATLIAKIGHPHPLCCRDFVSPRLGLIVCVSGHTPLRRPGRPGDGTRPSRQHPSKPYSSRSAGNRGTRVGSVNTSAVMSIPTLAVMSIHSAQSANVVQIIGIPSPGLGTLW